MTPPLQKMREDIDAIRADLATIDRSLRTMVFRLGVVFFAALVLAAVLIVVAVHADGEEENTSPQRSPIGWGVTGSPAPISKPPVVLQARPSPTTHVAGSSTTLRVTEYCWTGHRTASGTWPQLGDVATLDRSIPFGTRLHIAGLGRYVVTDRIGHGSDIDLYAGRDPGCEARALRFGVRYLEVAGLR